MLNKIISGGQTGADQGALDAAIKLGAPHGGWIPKNRMTEDGPLPAQYNLDEMPTTSYPKRTEKNILESNGTVIITRGRLTGGSALTRKLAQKHTRPFLHVDLSKTPTYLAASNVRNWVLEHNIGVLNVAGSRASKDPAIYRNTRYIIEGVFLLDLVKAQPSKHLGKIKVDLECKGHQSEMSFQDLFEMYTGGKIVMPKK